MLQGFYTINYCCRVVNFQLAFLSTGNCDPPSSADKGVELAVGNGEGDGHWVPVAYYYLNKSRRSQIEIGTFNDPFDSVGIRGYSVPATKLELSTFMSLNICDPTLLDQRQVQFRWLETSRHSTNQVPPVDVWILDNVSIKYINGDDTLRLLQDAFDSQILK